MQQEFSMEKFAEIMAEPWTCIRCGTVFTPEPDKPQTIPYGIQTKLVAIKGGDFRQVKEGDICQLCMPDDQLATA